MTNSDPTASASGDASAELSAHQEPGPPWQPPRPGGRRRRWIVFARLLSIAIVLLALRWIVDRVAEDGAALASYRPPPSFLVFLVLVIPALAVIELLPTFAWSRLLVVFGGAGGDEDPRRRTQNLLIHAKMQVARYLPGHAFQVGRHALTREISAPEKVPHSTLGAAATCEAVGMIAGAAAIASLGFGAAFGGGALNLGQAIPHASLRWAPWLALALVLCIPPLVARLAGSRLLPGVVAHRPRDSFRVFGLYGLYFAFHGLIFGLFLTLVHMPTEAGPDWTRTLVAGAGALPLAWAIGFLTPGTPAGAGATEAVLVAMLGARYGAVEVLAAALGYRLASVAAHGLLASIAAWIDHRRGADEPQVDPRTDSDDGAPLPEGAAVAATGSQVPASRITT